MQKSDVTHMIYVGGTAVRYDILRGDVVGVKIVRKVSPAMAEPHFSPFALEKLSYMHS